jgi:hypothetical protein
MPKKKINQTPDSNQTVFSEAAAQEAAAITSQAAAAQAAGQTAQDAASAASSQAAQIPPDVAELIRSTLVVVLAQRKTQGFAITLAALAKTVKKTLERYLRRTPQYVVREFVKSELEAMGYPIITALVEHRGELYRAEVVVMYRNYQEFLEMIQTGRLSGIMRPLVANDVDLGYDTQVKHA